MNKITIYVLLACLWTVSAVQAQSFGSPAMRKLQMAEFAISNFYVDKVDEDKLVEEAIIKMLAQLDPHSTYSDAEEVKKMNEPLQGNFEGIGVQFQMIEDTLLVVQPVSNGPSEKIGILAGDRIIAVNDSAIAGVKMSTEEIMKRLRGPKGSKVNLKIVRRGVQDPLVFCLDNCLMYAEDMIRKVEDETGMDFRNIRILGRRDDFQGLRFRHGGWKRDFWDWFSNREESDAPAAALQPRTQDR